MDHHGTMGLVSYGARVDTNPDETDMILQELGWESPSTSELQTKTNGDYISNPLSNQNSNHSTQYLDPEPDLLTQSLHSSPQSMDSSSFTANPLDVAYGFPVFDTFDMNCDPQEVPRDYFSVIPEGLEWPQPGQPLIGTTGWDPNVSSNEQLKSMGMNWDDMELPQNVSLAISTPNHLTTSAPNSTMGVRQDPLTCTHCHAHFIDKTKLKIHINKHTKPFRCDAAGCGYATAEKKSLQRHLLARSRWDEEHRIAARDQGVREVRYRCPKSGMGCTYSTIREDNLKRHMTKCPA